MFIPLLTVTSSICTIICIAGDRYRVMIYRQTLHRWESIVVVCLIWLVAFCVSAPQLYEYNIYYKTNEATNSVQLSCGSERIVEQFETIYAIVVFVLLYCLPLLILAFCYIRISALVWKNAKRIRSTVAAELPTNNPTNSNHIRQLESMISARKIKVLQMLISITVAFVVLWTPYFILFAIQVRITESNSIIVVAISLKSTNVIKLIVYDNMKFTFGRIIALIFMKNHEEYRWNTKFRN